MAEKTHTPGPWNAKCGPINGKQTWCVDTASPRSGHGRVYDIATLDNNPEAEANALLVAGAPIALEALEELVDLVEAVRAGEYVIDSFTLQPAQIAIAISRGKALDDV